VIDPRGLRARAAVLAAVRAFLAEHGYREVPTPALVPSPAMEEHLHALAVGGGFLRTSPEFALKRAVAAGLPRVYELGPCFRAREHGPWHRQEFWMLEWYRAGAGLADLMDEVEALVARAAAALGVAGPARWERSTVPARFAALGLDLTTATAAELGARPGDSWDDAFFRRWLEQVEPALPPAVFVRDWPASQAALAQVRTDGPHRAERFEAYLNGVELANAFLELIDAGEQRRRFEAANAARVAAGEPPHPVDEALIDAVGRMPPTAGIALGVDRLVAALLGWDGIDRGRVE
jgi:lysyl-tRNA synthetase class 2